MQIAIVVLLGIIALLLAYLAIELPHDTQIIRHNTYEAAMTLDKVFDILVEMRKDAAYMWKQSKDQTRGDYP